MSPLFQKKSAKLKSESFKKAKEVIYVGMDLVPPPDEICSKLVFGLTHKLNKNRPIRILSIPNPSGTKKKGAFENIRSIVLPFRNSLLNAMILPLYLLKYAKKETSIVHFFMPAKQHRYVAFLLLLCKIKKVPTVFTLLKNNKNQIMCAGNASAVAAQTQSGFKKTVELLPAHPNILFISPGAFEKGYAASPKKINEVLFVGVPWKAEDLERRGVFLLFEVIRKLQKDNDDIHVTILNRALNNTPVLERLATGILPERLSIKEGAVEDISKYYSQSSVFLCLHLDALCPDPPLSVIEACACGCPVVTTRFNSLAEDIRSEGAGFLAEPTPESICDGIRQILEAPSFYEKNALRFANVHFSDEIFSSSYDALYQIL